MNRRASFFASPPFPFIALASLSLLLPLPAFAQRYIPAAGQWSAPSALHPLASGSLGGATVTATGSLAEGHTSDSGYFLHRPAGEGDDFRVCLGTVSTTGVSGVMVRDSADPASAFVFAGMEASGHTVVLHRHRAGEPVVRIPFGATGVNKWFRLVVGRDTVYAYSASAATAGIAGAWGFLAAVKIDLAGGAPWERRADLGGLFVGQGATSFSDLYQTEELFWNEPTTTADAAVQSPPGSWTETAPEPGQFAESEILLKREDGSGPAHVDFPVITPVASTYRAYLHCVSGNGSPVQAALVVGGVQQTPVSISNVPAGIDSWLYVGTVATTAGPGLTFSVRLFDPGGAGSTVYADAARAMLVTMREAGTLSPVMWTRTPPERVNMSANGQTANDLRRNAQQANGTWNAGADSDFVLIGDGRMQFVFIGNGLRLQAGANDDPTGNDPNTINFRFFSKANGKVSALGGGGTVEFNQNNNDWLELERIGSQIFFRQNQALLQFSTVPSSGPLYLDVAFQDQNARIHASRIIGHWTHPNYASNLDADTWADSLERWVIDADPEDAIQSIFDVNMNVDSDGDGLTNLQEYNLNPRTNPTKADTDGDGLSDGDEVNVHQTDPLNPDSDGDGLSDGEEIGLHDTDPLDPDSDGDGIGDKIEVDLGLDVHNPAVPDTVGQLGLRVYTPLD